MDRENRHLPIDGEEDFSVDEALYPPDGGASRRRKIAGRGKLYVLGALIAIVLGVIYLPFFRLNDITVTGNHFIPKDEVIKMAGIYRDEHIFQVDVADAAKLLLKDLRVEKAQVKRAWLDGLVIDIHERQPVLTVVCEYGHLDLDRNGLVLSAYRDRRTVGVPLLAGATVRDLYIGDTVGAPLIKNLTDYLGQLGAAAVAEIKAVNVENPEQVVCTVITGEFIRLGKLERLPEKAAITKNFLAELKKARHSIEYIDLSFTTPFVKLKDGDKTERKRGR